MSDAERLQYYKSFDDPCMNEFCQELQELISKGSYTGDVFDCLELLEDYSFETPSGFKNAIPTEGSK